MSKPFVTRIKKLAAKTLPPPLLRLLAECAGPVRFSGRYHSWAEAMKSSGGYDKDLILDKVRDAALKVKNGEAVYERDSVLFDEIRYSWPLAAALMWVALQNRNRLDLIDFGGSLGSTYFQNRSLLKDLDALHWNIVEQTNFVRCGKEHFENRHLKFFNSIDDCIKAGNPDTILFSSVLQYLEDPYAVLERALRLNFRFILFDRTSFTASGPDRLTVQKISSAIYKASYPAWFFSRERFLSFFERKYELIAEFDSSDTANIPSSFKGFIFRRSSGHVQHR